MNGETKEILDSYVSWLKEKTTVREIEGDWTEITTPYLDRHNDALQIYVKHQGNALILSDDGYVIDDLKQSGCNLDTPKRQSLLGMTLAGFGVQNTEGRLEVHATPENFPLKKHSLIQAMLAVNDLFYLSVPMVASLFFEDVVAWLEVNDVRYTPSVKFTGKSGFDHLFDFVIPKSRRQPERVLQTITQPSRSTAEALAFKWVDTKDVRSPESRAYAIINDQEQRVSSAIIDAFQNYDVTPVLWTQREEIMEELAA